MFVGREDELDTLGRQYERRGFKMVVLYGRRRVGKTTLVDHFVRNRRALYFTAQQKSDAINLRAFSQAVYRFFGMPEGAGAFLSWSDALSYVADRASRDEAGFVFVFDEFPYAAEACPSLPSALQLAIDHGFSGTNVLMILCGSNEGFMESEVLGVKSPLYGRRTAQIRLKPFDYYDAARMLPGHLTCQERVQYYSAFGGTPYYLAQIDPSASFESNIAELFFNVSGLLYEEPLMLLRQELREPALYHSVLDAVASGRTNPKGIAEAAGVDPNAAGRYLKTLEDLGIVEREVPLGESPGRTRRSKYALADPFFSFWYRFVSPSIGAIEAGAGRAAATSASGPALATYVGTQFERVCLQWLVRQNRQGKLPFLATAFGRWWGTDPRAREEVDIDVMATAKATSSALFGECKWRGSFDETEALRKLEQRASLPGDFRERYYVLFSREPVSQKTRRKAAERDDVRLIDAEGLYEGL